MIPPTGTPDDATECEIAWLAGLLEGEGCFYCGDGGRVLIRLAMTDQDVVDRAALIMGGRKDTPRRPGVDLKTVYATRLAGERALVWMRTLRPLMGARRREKIDEVLAFAAARPGKRFNSCGGRDKPRRGAYGLQNPRTLRQGTS